MGTGEKQQKLGRINISALLCFQWEGGSKRRTHVPCIWTRNAPATYISDIWISFPSYPYSEPHCHCWKCLSRWRSRGNRKSCLIKTFDSFPTNEQTLFNATCTKFYKFTLFVARLKNLHTVSQIFISHSNFSLLYVIRLIIIASCLIFALFYVYTFQFRA